MRVVVPGGTGVVGRAAVAALVQAGHEVVVTTRSPANEALVRSLGGAPVGTDLFDVDSLTAAFAGADAVVNLTSSVPLGYAAVFPGAWRHNDALCTTGVRNVVEAARRCGVRRLVQHSASLLYADAGEDWITEGSPLEITSATEPMSVAEAQAQDFASGARTAVVLRLGRIVGDDPLTRHVLQAARHRRPVVLGHPEAWTHVLHTDDLGAVVVAALCAPSGTYNVGAEPVRRGELARAYSERAGIERSNPVGPLLRRLAGPRLEPLLRSLRVGSDRFTAHTGWHPQRSRFAADWLDVSTLEPAG